MAAAAPRPRRGGIAKEFLTRVADFFRVKPKPQQRQGVGGTNAVGGFLVSAESNADLTYGPQRFKTLNQMLLNTGIVGACSRYYLAMGSGVGWTVEPPDVDNLKAIGKAKGGSIDQAKKYAEIVDDAIHDMEMPWSKFVKGTLLFRLLGYSVQEWVAKRRADGNIGFLTIERRPQWTIEQWDIDEDGLVAGFVQRVPYSGQLLYLPRDKVVYVVDDTVTDQPDGVGLLRHVVETNRQLKRLEQLEGWGYETDARGIPVGSAPLGLLAQLVSEGVITPAERDRRVRGINNIVANHVKNPGLGLVMDSSVYTDIGPLQTPSAQKMYGLELLRGDGAGLHEIHETIVRKNEEIARVFGLEHVLLGAGGKGSLALSQDKTELFAQLITGTLNELADCYRVDVVGTLFDLNGWDRDLMPRLIPDKVQLSSVVEMMNAIVQLKQAGAYMPPDDPVFGQIRDMLGVVGAPVMPPQIVGPLGRPIPAPGQSPFPGAPGSLPGAQQPPGQGSPNVTRALDGTENTSRAQGADAPGSYGTVDRSPVPQSGARGNESPLATGTTDMATGNSDQPTPTMDATGQPRDPSTGVNIPVPSVLTNDEEKKQPMKPVETDVKE
jgi:hypothetical protein